MNPCVMISDTAQSFAGNAELGVDHVEWHAVKNIRVRFDKGGISFFGAIADITHYAVLAGIDASGCYPPVITATLFFNFMDVLNFMAQSCSDCRRYTKDIWRKVSVINVTVIFLLGLGWMPQTNLKR